jgi:hypothetical protein
MIFGPQFSSPMHRIQAVDPDRQESDHKEGRKKRVLHQGRTWGETEEELPIQPSMIQNPVPEVKTRKGPVGVYADPAVLEHAHKLFQGLITIEEKVAQLCFLVTDAIYDTDLQKNVEFLIQAWQIGGILFHKGEYRRQSFLIERYQQLSKTPLLLGNDFMHGLSFYLQGDPVPSKPISKQHYSDLGKAVMAQNRSIGVHVQFDRERGSQSAMTEEQAKAFHQGVRNAHGIVGKEKASQKASCIQLQAGGAILSTFSEASAQETIGFKTLTFFDVSQMGSSQLAESLPWAFKEQYDVLLFGNNIKEGISLLAQLVLSGKLSEAALDKHVMKTLIIKSYFAK